MAEPEKYPNKIYRAGGKIKPGIEEEINMKQYIVDAFTDKIFHGNPAAVCVMDKWLPDNIMMDIADENHLSETAFAVKEDGKYRLRWFSPGGEVDLCGHATLAAAFIILNFYECGMESVEFTTMSGKLTVVKNGDLYEMDFPAYKLNQIPVTEEMTAAIGIRPLEAWMARDLVCILPNQADVLKYTPELTKVKELPGLLLHTTSMGKDSDCVTRSFAPKLNIPEDPVCGSGHCHVVPLWSEKLCKKSIIAYQASKRGGILYCKLNDERITLAGNAVVFAESEIKI